MKNWKTLAILGAALLSSVLTGCGRIETGNVGVRTEVNGAVNQNVEGQGFYTAVLSHVDQYSTKEIPVNLDNLTPKAHDNLSLRELDVTVYYKVRPDAIRNLVVKYTGQSMDSSHGFWYPAYYLVDSVAKSEISDVISKMDSLVVHTQRKQVENSSMKQIQADLDKSDPGVFTVTRVVVRQVRTDSTIEQSIRNVVAKEKEKEAAALQVDIAHLNAEANQKTAETLTPQFLQHEYNQVLMAAFQSGKVGNVIIDGSSSAKMMNLK